MLASPVPPSFLPLPLCGRATRQVEAERTEVLRLSTALDEMRSAARQDAKAANDREAALKALLASETEASSHC